MEFFVFNADPIVQRKRQSCENYLQSIGNERVQLNWYNSSSPSPTQIAASELLQSVVDVAGRSRDSGQGAENDDAAEKFFFSQKPLPGPHLAPHTNREYTCSPLINIVLIQRTFDNDIP